MCPTLNFTSLVYVFVFIFLWRVLILGQLRGFMWQGRESLRSARIRAMPAHSSRTSDGLKGTVIIRTRVGEAEIARKKSFFSGAALKYFQKTIPLIPKQNKVINGLAIGSNVFFFLLRICLRVLTHRDTSSVTWWGLKIVLIRWENRWAEVWPESPAKLPACLLKHHWTQPTHDGCALAPQPWRSCLGKWQSWKGVRDQRWDRWFLNTKSVDILKPSPAQNWSVVTSNVACRIPGKKKQCSLLMLVKQTLIQDEFTAAQKFYFPSNQKLACALQHVATLSAFIATCGAFLPPSVQ